MRFTSVIVKMAPIGTQTPNCFSRVRRSAGLSIPGRDTDCLSCSVFICALRSLYSALKSIPLHIIVRMRFTVVIGLIRTYPILSLLLRPLKNASLSNRCSGRRCLGGNTICRTKLSSDFDKFWFENSDSGEKILKSCFLPIAFYKVIVYLMKYLSPNFG